jgi:hypothetical protein
MADTLKRLYGPAQPTATAATLYTVPASTITVLRFIRFVNTTGTDRTITLSIGADSAATRFFPATTIPAGGALDWSGSIPMTAGEIIQGSSSAAAAVNVIIAGVEVV